MSKIAQYLNEHILGEVTSSRAVRERFSRDASVLSITPELVIFPRVTNDIRKAARFSWQLAEKGHVLPITTRGGGSDQTGAAIGRGIIINTTAHLNNIIHIALKDKEHVVHVQPGVNFKSLNDTLQWHGLNIPTAPESAAYSTIGGAVANNSGGQFSGRYGLTGDWVTRLEVVLANGDLIETTRLNKRELSKKKGMQTFEGEVYRKIDGLIEDNQDLIKNKLEGDDRDNSGYRGIAKVKNRDGSFDLTPLLIGSQGTLGIISEIVLKTEFISKEQSIVVAVLPSNETARDVADALKSTQPSSLETLDGALFDAASNVGKHYSFFEGSSDVVAIGAVVYVSFNDFSDRARSHKLKKAVKILQKGGAITTVTTDDHAVEDLVRVREIYSSILTATADDESMPPILDGASVPFNRSEEFTIAVNELAAKHHITLPLKIRVLDGVIMARPTLQLAHVSDKQKVFKLISEYQQLVEKFGGSLIAESGEGRLKTNAAYTGLDAETIKLYQDIRETFDPFCILNTGVKQVVEVSEFAKMLRSSYDTADFAQYSVHI